MSKEHDERAMSTADLVAAGERHHEPVEHPPMQGDPSLQERTQHQGMDPQGMQQRQGTQQQGMQQVETHPMTDGGTHASAAASMPAAQGAAAAPHGERLAALFPPDMAEAFRQHWSSVQIGFVDDPRGAVQQADELVAKVMKSLAERFASQRASIEADLGHDEQSSTEHMRMALRSYRSFFERLLSL